METTQGHQIWKPRPWPPCSAPAPSSWKAQEPESGALISWSRGLRPMSLMWKARHVSRFTYPIWYSRPGQLSHLGEDKLSDISGECRKYYRRPSESMLNAEQNSSHHWDQTVQVGGRERELCKPWASSWGSWDWFYMIDDLGTECQVINCLSSCHGLTSRSLFPGAQSERFLFCLFVWPGAGACQAQLCNFTKAFWEKTGDNMWQKGTRLEVEAAELGVCVSVCVCV